MYDMKSICVFCGSGTGNNTEFSQAARSLGDLLASRRLKLVYGGSNIGLMGIISAAVRDGGSRVTGVIPERIADNVPGQRGIDLEVVPGMHERKSRMYELSDGFIALPGGIGTLEETFEAWTWNQLGYFAKPLALLNVSGFYNPLISFLDGITSDGFVKKNQRESLIVEADPEALLGAMERWTPPAGVKWEGLKPSS